MLDPCHSFEESSELIVATDGYSHVHCNPFTGRARTLHFRSLLHDSMHLSSNLHRGDSTTATSGL